MWNVLNSSFVLWFLSSVVVAGLTAAFTWYKKRQTDQAATAASLHRLNTEIGNRIAGGLVALHLDETRIARGNTYYSGSIYNEAISYLDNRVLDDKRLLDFSIYPDFRWRGFRSLIFELGALVSAVELPALRKANSTYDKIVSLADHACLSEDGSVPPDMGKTGAAVRDSLALLAELQSHRPWKSEL